jgi:hypothetical protein
LTFNSLIKFNKWRCSVPFPQEILDFENEVKRVHGWKP